jgi:hypothetical protein
MKLGRKRAEIFRNYWNSSMYAIGQEEAMHRKYENFNLAAVRPTTLQATHCSLGVIRYAMAWPALQSCIDSGLLNIIC